MIRISKEAFNVLQEIIENENVKDYWKKRFHGFEQQG